MQSDPLDIPDILLRNADGTFKNPPFAKPVTETVPEPEVATEQDPFAQFKTELYDPEPDILREARERRRNWLPTKADPRQPSLRSFASRVRAEWKREGKI